MSLDVVSHASLSFYKRDNDVMRIKLDNKWSTRAFLANNSVLIRHETQIISIRQGRRRNLSPFGASLHGSWSMHNYLQCLNA